jgi:predicted Zn-dependent protease
VNAIAAPGGFIFATRGLFDFVKSQDELAFVIGHETTHVAHRHAVKQAQENMEVQFAATILVQVLFHGAYLPSQLTNLAGHLIEAKFSRDQEYEADHYGVIYAGKAGLIRRSRSRSSTACTRRRRHTRAWSTHSKTIPTQWGESRPCAPNSRVSATMSPVRSRRAQ